MNNDKGEKISYTKPLLSDSIDCYNLKDIYLSDTLYTDSIINKTYVNRINKPVNLTVIYNHFIGLKFYGYNQVYKNGTLEEDGLIYDYKVGEGLYNKYIDSCIKLNISFSLNNDLNSLLNCYKQGTTSYLVDRYGAKDGCEFLNNILQNKSLLHIKNRSRQENYIRITEIINSRISILQTSTQEIKIKVYNLLGTLILEKKSNLQEDEIVIPHNIQSIYILNIYNLVNEIIYSNKIVIL